MVRQAHHERTVNIASEHLSSYFDRKKLLVMSKEVNKISTLSDFPEYYKWLSSLVYRHGYFSVHLSDSVYGLSLKKRLQLYKNVLDKFIPVAEYFLIYDLNTKSKRVKPFLEYFIKEFSRHKISFPGNSWKTFDPILDDILNYGGQL